MTALLWLAVGILGPGALAVLAWFLRDVRRVLGPVVARGPARRPDAPPAPPPAPPNGPGAPP